MLSEFYTSTRPTRSRLYTAMGISTCLVALLLASLDLLVEFETAPATPGIDNRDPLSVYIRQRVPEAATPPAIEQEAEPVETAAVPPVTAPVPAPAIVAESPAVKDWLAIADDAARAGVDEYVRQEEFKASQWQNSRSVMFQPANDFVIQDEEPLLADIRFRHRSRVLGIGVNIGSCFIGIPIVGVPVEERSGALTVFVCSRGSG